MSSIRLFLLDALAQGGEMHGHQLRQLAEQEHVDRWTDITVGALYGALKRMSADGLIETARTERSGRYPERQVWRITDEGRATLREIGLESLERITVRPDPFDLALARIGPTRPDELAGIVRDRIERMRELVDEAERHRVEVDRWLSPGERFVMSHRPHRLRAEIAWHEELLDRLPGIIAAEKEWKNPT